MNVFDRVKRALIFPKRRVGQKSFIILLEPNYFFESWNLMLLCYDKFSPAIFENVKFQKWLKRVVVQNKMKGLLKILLQHLKWLQIRYKRRRYWNSKQCSGWVWTWSWDTLIRLMKLWKFSKTFWSDVQISKKSTY